MKNVKRVIAVMAVVIMMLLLSACGGELADSKYLGTWEATVATMDDVELDVDKIIDDFTMVLEADGTVTLKVNDDEGKGEWKETEKGIALVEDEQSMEFTADGEELIVEQDGIEIHFEKAE